MKTDDLIARLVNDLPSSPTSAPARAAASFHSVAGLTLAMIAAAVAMSAMIYGLRPDGPLNGAPGLLLWSIIAFAALALTQRARAPDVALKGPVLALLCGLSALVLALAVFAHAAGQPMVRLDHVLHCLQTVGLLACPSFIVISVLLRRSAPASPVLAGAVAGLSAAAIGALAYSVSCPISDPLASLSAHAIAVLSFSAVGAAIGWRLYAW
ncbi:MAG: NrsF family protein [Pseudomonadota bacterium]